MFLKMNNSAMVIFADKNRSAMSIGKTTYLFQVFIMPTAFKLNILIFDHISD
jgi:hypothetical protein